jgi:hypothetical protein
VPLDAVGATETISCPSGSYVEYEVYSQVVVVNGLHDPGLPGLDTEAMELSFRSKYDQVVPPGPSDGAFDSVGEL